MMNENWARKRRMNGNENDAKLWSSLRRMKNVENLGNWGKWKHFHSRPVFLFGSMDQPQWRDLLCNVHRIVLILIRASGPFSTHLNSWWWISSYSTFVCFEARNIKSCFHSRCFHLPNSSVVVLFRVLLFSNFLSILMSSQERVFPKFSNNIFCAVVRARQQTNGKLIKKSISNFWAFSLYQILGERFSTSIDAWFSL